MSLPFCFPYFQDFTNWVLKGGDLAAGRGVLLLVPFLLGFSTTLVMAVLNRMVAGIESMFGIERSVSKAGVESMFDAATALRRQQSRDRAAEPLKDRAPENPRVAELLKENQDRAPDRLKEKQK